MRRRRVSSSSSSFRRGMFSVTSKAHFQLVVCSTICSRERSCFVVSWTSKQQERANESGGELELTEVGSRKDVVSSRTDRTDSHELSGLTRTSSHGGDTVLESCQSFFEDGDGGLRKKRDGYRNRDQFAGSHSRSMASKQQR